MWGQRGVGKLFISGFMLWFEESKSQDNTNSCLMPTLQEKFASTARGKIPATGTWLLAFRSAICFQTQRNMQMTQMIVVSAPHLMPTVVFSEEDLEFIIALSLIQSKTHFLVNTNIFCPCPLCLRM